MNIPDIQQFGQDMIEVLALNSGKIDLQKWNRFLSQYFKANNEKKLRDLVEKDLHFFRENDPASMHYTWDQILSIRRGMIAIVAHRIFQAVLQHDQDFIFEMEVIAKQVQAATNVEIHPTAQFGQGFAIDHGHGTVVGATTVAGDNIFIYHGVTLGATGNRSQSDRRHPKIGNHIFLGNGAQILGPSILENNIKVASEAMIIDSYIEADVVISPSVLISKVRVPKGYKVYGYDPKERKHIASPPGQKTGEFIQFEKVNVKDFEV